MGVVYGSGKIPAPRAARLCAMAGGRSAGRSARGALAPRDARTRSRGGRKRRRRACAQTPEKAGAMIRCQRLARFLLWIRIQVRAFAEPARPIRAGIAGSASGPHSRTSPQPAQALSRCSRLEHRWAVEHIRKCRRRRNASCCHPRYKALRSAGRPSGRRGLESAGRRRTKRAPLASASFLPRHS